MTIPRAKRHNLYFLDVFDGRNGEPLGQVVDISATGISILGEIPLNCPSTYLLKILVPEAEGAEYLLEFQAESRWSQEQSGSYTTGFHIGPLTQEQQKRIETLVNAFGYSKIGEVRTDRAPAPERSTGGLRHLLQTLFTR